MVRQDGKVVCYHFYERNDLEDYLFEHTVIDTPSQSRHKFGQIYAIDGEFYLEFELPNPLRIAERSMFCGSCVGLHRPFRRRALGLNKPEGN